MKKLSIILALFAMSCAKDVYTPEKVVHKTAQIQVEVTTDTEIDLRVTINEALYYFGGEKVITLPELQKGDVVEATVFLHDWDYIKIRIGSLHRANSCVQKQYNLIYQR